jgi:outer membrane protein OmpA-like peptidoglycan-associated protein
VLDVEVVAERGIAIRSRILPKGGITTPWEEQNKLVLTLSATEGAAAESAAVAAGASTAPTAPAAPAAPAAPSLAPEPPPAVASAPEPAPEPPPKLAAAREPAAAPGTGEGALAARADPERAARVAAAPSPAVASAPPAPAAAPARWTAVDECEGVVLRFDFDRAALPDDARRVLDRFASCAAAAGLQVQVDGHGDARGGEEYNRWLAWDRAASVTAYLREHGVADRRIVTRSHGAARPLCAEASEDCHARNRRVELIPAR